VERILEITPLKRLTCVRPVYGSLSINREVFRAAGWPYRHSLRLSQFGAST
jgi:hypothetical protein